MRNFALTTGALCALSLLFGATSTATASDGAASVRARPAAQPDRSGDDRTRADRTRASRAETDRAGRTVVSEGHGRHVPTRRRVAPGSALGGGSDTAPARTTPATPTTPTTDRTTASTATWSFDDPRGFDGQRLPNRGAVRWATPDETAAHPWERHVREDAGRARTSAWTRTDDGNLVWRIQPPADADASVTGTVTRFTATGTRRVAGPTDASRWTGSTARAATGLTGFETRFDANGDGRLDRDEAARRTVSHAAYVAGLVRAFDFDGDGRIDEGTWRSFADRVRSEGNGSLADTLERTRSASQRLSLLETLDRNGDGRVEARERRTPSTARPAAGDAGDPGILSNHGAGNGRFMRPADLPPRVAPGSALGGATQPTDDRD